MTSLMTSPGHKVSQILKLIHLRQYLSYSVDQKLKMAIFLGLALLTLSWDKNWDSHSLVNGYPSFYPRKALVAPSPGIFNFRYNFR